jgi:hypothetical protein
MIQEGKIYERKTDGILRKVQKLVIDERHAGGVRVEFDSGQSISTLRLKRVARRFNVALTSSSV